MNRDKCKQTTLSGGVGLLQFLVDPALAASAGDQCDDAPAATSIPAQHVRRRPLGGVLLVALVGTRKGDLVVADLHGLLAAELLA